MSAKPICHLISDASWLVPEATPAVTARKVVPLEGSTKIVPMPSEKYPFVGWMHARHDAWVEYIQLHGHVLVECTYQHLGKSCSRVFQISCTFPDGYVHGASRATFWVMQSEGEGWSRPRQLVF